MFSGHPRYLMLPYKSLQLSLWSGTLSPSESIFSVNKIATLKNDLKDLEEQQRNIPQWIQSAKNFEYGNDLGGSDETVIELLALHPVSSDDSSA